MGYIVNQLVNMSAYVNSTGKEPVYLDTARKVGSEAARCVPSFISLCVRRRAAI